jgi:hypothetical protein
MPLSQFSITNAKPKTAPYMLCDGEGLNLLVQKPAANCGGCGTDLAVKPTCFHWALFPR